MNKLNVILAIVCISVYSATLISSLSIESECYIEQRVRSALSASTNRALNDSLLLFFQKSINESVSGSIQQAWARNYVIQTMAGELSSNPSSAGVLSYVSNLFTQPSNSSDGYCSLLKNAQNAISSSRLLTKDQQSELYALIDYALEVARSQSCNIWGSLWDNPSYNQLLINATFGLTCQQQSMLAEVTGCQADLCSNSTINH